MSSRRYSVDTFLTWHGTRLHQAVDDSAERESRAVTQNRHRPVLPTAQLTRGRAWIRRRNHWILSMNPDDVDWSGRLDSNLRPLAPQDRERERKTGRIASTELMVQHSVVIRRRFVEGIPGVRAYSVERAGFVPRRSASAVRSFSWNSLQRVW